MRCIWVDEEKIRLKVRWREVVTCHVLNFRGELWRCEVARMQGTFLRVRVIFKR